MIDLNQVKFDDKGLAPAIIQDSKTKDVLMLGFMNKESLAQTIESGKVTFYSRSKQRLWVKGETSNNFLNLESIALDCDQDAILIKAKPEGPTCHKGTTTCWGESEQNIFQYLEDTIQNRLDNPSDQSYVSSLAQKGINKVAQKVGEEAVEVVIEAKDNDEDLFLNETADLIFHILVLLHFKGYNLSAIEKTLEKRRK